MTIFIIHNLRYAIYLLHIRIAIVIHINLLMRLEKPIYVIKRLLIKRPVYISFSYSCSFFYCNFFIDGLVSTLVYRSSFIESQSIIKRTLITTPRFYSLFFFNVTWYLLVSCLHYRRKREMSYFHTEVKLRKEFET